MRDAVAYPLSTSIERNTSVLALSVYTRDDDNTTNTTCTSEALGPFGHLPSNVAFVARRQARVGALVGLVRTVNCYIFADVTYSAGAALCASCRVASGGVVESDVSALTLEEDPATMLAFALMPEVIATMAHMNVSTPNTWDNIETYTREILMRS